MYDLFSQVLLWLGGGIGLLVALALFVGGVVGVRYVPNRKIGLVERWWSSKGSVPEGHILALERQAGFQAEILRGGIHLWMSPLAVRIHQHPLVTVGQGTIGYVYARDGVPLDPSQTLGRVVDSNSFQDARGFLEPDAGALGGQRGRQRAIMREGVYAINPALFVVITEDFVFGLRSLLSPQEASVIARWQEELRETGGFESLGLHRPPPATSSVSACEPVVLSVAFTPLSEPSLSGLIRDNMCSYSEGRTTFSLYFCLLYTSPSPRD